MAMVFSPSTGFQDTTQFPDSDPEIRAHMQALIEQIPAYVDEQLLAKAIVETGSNDNGYYVKFGDGTLICWVQKVVTDQALNTAYGSLYRGTRTWTFPCAFKDGSLPNVNCSQFKWDTGAAWGTVNGIPSSNSSVLQGIDIASRSSGSNVYIGASAFGKWK